MRNRASTYINRGAPSGSIQYNSMHRQDRDGRHLRPVGHRLQRPARPRVMTGCGLTAMKLQARATAGRRRRRTSLASALLVRGTSEDLAHVAQLDEVSLIDLNRDIPIPEMA